MTQFESNFYTSEMHEIMLESVLVERVRQVAIKNELAATNARRSMRLSKLHVEEWTMVNLL